MSTTATTAAKAALFGLYVWGIIAVGVFPAKNGFFTIFLDAYRTGRLPYNPELTVRSTYTGIGPVDAYLKGLIMFFWMMVSGRCPDLSLHSIEFFGQGFALWSVVLIEGSRAGNKGKLVSYVTTLGLIIQALSLCLNGPGYFALHLFTSPTVSGLSPSSLVADTNTLRAIPISLIIGYGGPSLLMALSAPSIFSYDQKQIFAALFQPFPALVYLVLLASTAYLSQAENSKVSSREKKENYVSALRRVYTFGLAVATICHAGSHAISLATVVFPKAFGPELAAAWHPSMVFMLTSPLSGVQVPNLSRGAIWMLQWGLLNGTVAFYIWGTALYVNSYTAQKKQNGLLQVLGKAALVNIIAGPAGAGLLSVWERDELMLEDRAVEKKAL